MTNISEQARNKSKLPKITFVRKHIIFFFFLIPFLNKRRQKLKI